MGFFPVLGFGDIEFGQGYPPSDPLANLQVRDLCTMILQNVGKVAC